MKNFLESLTCEKGNAAAELAILIPLYMLVTFGMFFLGELGLAQQAAEKSARYSAWAQDSSEASKMFKSYPYPNNASPQVNHSYTQRGLFSKKDIDEALKIREDELRARFEAEYDKFPENAAKLLNGIQGKMFKVVKADVTFQLGIKGLPFSGPVEIKASHTAILPSGEERKGLGGGARHGIETFTGNLEDE